MSKTEPRKRFKNLTLKKNLIKDDNFINKTGRDSDVIFLDESMDYLRTPNLTKLKATKVYSPIVIEDSDESYLKDTSRSVLQEINHSIPKINLSVQQEPERQTRPSITGWSPAQNIICATPKEKSRPSTPRDKANVSQEQCSIKIIEQSQKKILDELYGEVWRSIPTLFKRRPHKSLINYEGITKKINFDDDGSDKENSTNIKEILSENKRLYLTNSSNKKTLPAPEGGIEKKSKKKLYTEVTVTPDVKKTRILKPNTTSKKLKGKSVTELVEILAKEKELLNNNSVNSVSNKIHNVCVTPVVDTVLSRLSFVGSLADNVPPFRRAPEAFKYIDNYKENKDKLWIRLFKEFNKKVFDDQLDADMPILWDKKLRHTAGTATNRQIKTANGDRVRTSSIKLSDKVVDSAQRLRDTLIHEMCHTATWVIDHQLKAGHGPLWRKWTRRALQIYPELGEITVCHSLDIHYKYTYKCTGCGYCIRRHSKSIDITKKCCGYCRNKFEIILNKKTKNGVVSTPARTAVNGFAKYVKDNYAEIKQGRNHAEVMKVLGEEFAKIKTK